MSILIKKYSITFFLLISSRYIYIEKNYRLKRILIILILLKF